MMASDSRADAPSRRRLAVAGGLLAVLVVAVVGYLLFRPRPGPEHGLVTGVVTLDGKPLGYVQVCFLPDPERGTFGDRAVADTDADGRYQLTTDRDGRAGAVLGTHRVKVFDLLTLPRPVPEVPAGSSLDPSITAALAALPPVRTKSRFPAVYDDVVNTPLRPVEVKPGEQTYDIALTSSPRK